MNFYAGWPKANKKSIPIFVIREVLERDNYTCQQCGKTGTFVNRFGKPAVVENPDNIKLIWGANHNERSLIKFELHHNEPRFLGGTNEADNLILFCFDCNWAKTYINLLKERASKHWELELKTEPISDVKKRLQSRA